MPLNFISTKASPPEPTDDNDAQLRNTLCFLTMICGIPEITAETAPVFYARIHALELLQGCFLLTMTTSKPTPRPITPADINRWVGLRTNASKMTETQFKKVISSNLKTFEKEYTETL